MKRLAVLLLLIAPHAFGRGVPDWVKAAAKTDVPVYPHDTKAVVLFGETVTSVSESGEIRTVYRRATKILNTEGREAGYARADFSALTKLVSIHAWSIAANGDEYEVKEREAVETSDNGGGVLYADQRAKVIHIPASDPGAVVAYEVELRTPKPQALQDAWHFQEEVPVRFARYTVQLPAGWSHEDRWFHATAPTPQVSGDATSWELHDVPPVKDEARRPPMISVAGRLALNFLPPAGQSASGRSWADVGRWYGALTQQRQTPTPELQAKVRELTANKQTPMEKIAALAAFAQRDIRYVAIEIGIGGYQPHPAGEIFANRYGDCKDKVTVLAAMLREIGIEPHYVLVAVDRGVIDRGFASLQGFNHVIIAIPLPAGVKQPAAAIAPPKRGTLLLFDPTDETTPLGSLPLYLQNNVGLLVINGGGDLIEMPPDRPESNQLRRTAKLALDANGTLSGSVTESRSGATASRMRSYLAALAVSERTRDLEHRVASSLAEFKVAGFTVENLDDFGKDLVLRYTVSAPAYARKSGNLLLVRSRVLGEKAETINDLAARAHPYATDGPSLRTEDVEILTPANVAVDELPLPANFETPDLAYRSATTFSGGVLHYHREYRVKSFQVARDALPELNKTLAAIVADERGSAVFKMP